LNSLITEYHRLSSDFKKPEYLGIAADLGKVNGEDFDEIWARKVNEGCQREGLPEIYPLSTPQEKPLPETG